MKKCPMCLTPLGKVHGNREFCSDTCRNKTRNLKQYGLTPEDYRQLLANRKCFICGRNMKRPHVDHDHTTGEVYGVICQRCNEWVLAHMGHGRVGLQRALRLVEYIQNPPARVMGGRYAVGGK